MAETLQLTVSLRDQLTPTLKQVNKALDETTAATKDASDASKGKNFEFDQAGKKATVLEKAMKQGERTVNAFNGAAGKTMSVMRSVGSSVASTASNFAKQVTGTVQASSAWQKYKGAVESVTAKVGSAVSSAGSKFMSFAGTVRTAAGNAASGFAQRLSPITSRVSSVWSSLSQSARSFAGRYAEAGRQIASQFDSAFTTGMNAVKKSAEAIGSAIVGGLGVVMTKGFSRLSGIENAQAKLKGLGNDAKTVNGIMDNAMTSVEGTAYSLDSAATSAASAVAAGIKPGKDLTKYLTTVANVAATAGMGMEESGAIFGKVAATGVAYTDNINQLADRGIPIWQKLSEVAGMSVADTAKSVSKGQITFEEFAKASELAVGNVAQEMGGTFTGAWMNFNAAMGRIGAQILEGIFPALAAGMQGLTTVAKGVGKSLVPMSEALGSKLAPVAEKLNTYFANLADSGMDGFISKIQELSTVLVPAMGALIGFGSQGIQGALGPLGKFVPTINPVLGAFLGLLAVSPELRSGLFELGQTIISILIPTFQTVGPILAGAFTVAAQAIGTVLGSVIGFIGESKVLTGILMGIAGAIGVAILAFKAYQGVIALVNGVKAIATAVTHGYAVAQNRATFSTQANTAAQWAGYAAQKAVALGSRIAAAAQWAWNAAVSANPIALIIIGITALVAALVWFFTQTETGKAIWQSVWTAIQTAVQAVVTWFQTVALPALQAVWNGIVAGAQWMWNNVLKPIWTVMQFAFLAVVTAIMLYWEMVLKPVFNAIASTAMWLWNNALKPAFNGIKWAWNMMVLGIKAYWEMVLKPVWNAVVAGAKWLWNYGLKPAFTGIKTSWNFMATGIRVIWESVLKPAWNAVVAGARWLWNSGVRPVLSAFKAGWRALGDGVRWVKDNIISPALQGVKSATSNMWNGMKPIFDAVKRGIKAVGDGFKLAKDVIKTAWDGIQRAAKKPAEFVVNTVYGKIRSIWNKAAGIFGMDDKKLPEIKMATGGHAHGRVLGPGTGTSDSIDAKLSNGEFVVNAAATRRNLPLLHAINGPGGVGAAEFAQRHGAGVPLMTGGYPAFASGGTLMDAADWWIGKGARGSEHPRFGRVGRHSRNSLHYSGRAVDLNYGPGGQNATEMGFFDRNVAAFKQAFPGIRVIWRAAGHYNHMHIDTSSGADIGSFKGGKDSGGFGFPLFDLNPLNAVTGLIDKFKNTSGLFGTGLKNAAKSLVQGAVDKISPFNNSADSGAVNDPGGQGAGVARWTDVVKRALQFVGQPTSQAMVNTVLRRMKQESGGNPHATNNWDSNARRGTPSKGLMQVIGPTFRAYAKAPYNKNILDPMSNIVASMRYALKRYGSLSAAYNRRGGYASGGLVTDPIGIFDNGGPWQPGTWGFNAGADTEMVLTGQQSDIITTGLKRMADNGSSGSTLTIENVNIEISGNVYGIDDLDSYLREAVEELMEDIEREWEERR